MDFTKLSKLEPRGAQSQAEPQGLVSAIVKVREPGYRPKNVHVRSNLSDELFTADLSEEVLADLQSDPKVESVALSRPIPLQKPG